MTPVPHLRCRRTLPGFTLLEVLLAVAIAAVVLVAIHGVFHGAVKLRQRNADALEQMLPLERTLALLRSDLENLALPGGTLSGAFQTTPTNTVSLQGQVGPQFCTTTGTLDEQLPWGNLQRVAYYLLPPTNGLPGRDLVRSVTRNLLATTTETSVPQEWMLGGVEDLRFEFYDGQMWQSEWDSTVNTTPLPLAIRVTLQLTSTNRLSRLPPPIELVVATLVDTSTNTTSTTTTSSSGTGMP